MLHKTEVAEAKRLSQALFQKAGFAISQLEMDNLEVADFGLGEYRCEGSQIITIVSTNRVGFKVICLLPNQTLPEHWHTDYNGVEGKEETLRVIYGSLFLYLPGVSSIKSGFIPRNKEECYTSRKEILMNVTDQITLEPGIKHWLQGGKEGAVVLSISSMATCAMDPFSDPNIIRKPIVEGEEGAACNE